MRKQIILFALLLGSLLTSFANERLFAYTYQSNVLNRTQREMEIWTDINAIKVNYYRQIANRIEFEMGVGKKTQTSFYVNFGQDARAVPDGSEVTLEKEFEISFSNEWKHQFSDPVANKLGSALYGEVTIGLNEFELEGKAIFDKKIKNFTTALNLVGEYEIETENEYEDGDIVKEREHELKTEADFAGIYSFDKGFSMGLEGRILSAFPLKEEKAHAALFLGPTFSYVAEKFWITFAAQPQVTAFTNRSEGKKLDLAEYNLINTRIIFALTF